VEFLGIDEHDVAQIAVGGGGCGSSGLAAVIEDAVQNAAPELAGVDFEDAAPVPVLLQIQPYRPGGQR
jgi:hypothetical protein